MLVRHRSPITANSPSTWSIDAGPVNGQTSFAKQIDPSNRIPVEFVCLWNAFKWNGVIINAEHHHLQFLKNDLSTDRSERSFDSEAAVENSWVAFRFRAREFQNRLRRRVSQHSKAMGIMPNRKWCNRARAALQWGEQERKLIEMPSICHLKEENGKRQNTERCEQMHKNHVRHVRGCRNQSQKQCLWLIDDKRPCGFTRKKTRIELTEFWMNWRTIEMRDNSPRYFVLRAFNELPFWNSIYPA